jgi:hypothetical protein
MINNLEPHIDSMPQLKDALTQLHKVITDEQVLRDHHRVLQTDAADATGQRDQLIATGDDLYSRLTRGLQAIHGAKNVRLKEFGVKPLRAGRPKKPSPDPTPPPVEAPVPVTGPVK